MSGPSGTVAMLQRYSPVSGGYPIAVRLLSQRPVSDWYAELILPTGASVAAGPGTSVAKQKVGLRLVPARHAITPTPGRPGTGVVYAAVVGTDKAPTHLRVWAKTAGGEGYAPISGVYLTGSRGRLVKATDNAWPGSASVQTDPTKWTGAGDGDGGAGFGGGFGFGGGGGGGGQHQTNLTIEVDDNGRLRKVLHTVDSDSGGGGGAGGGGGMGGGLDGGQDYAESGQQQAQQGQQQGQQQDQHGQQGHGGGNPLTRIETTVNDIATRVATLEEKVG